MTDKSQTTITQKVKCFLGLHDWKTDQQKTNGFWWRFCKNCGLRHAYYDGAWRSI